MIIAADFMRSAKARDSEFTTNKSKLSLLVVLEASGSQLLSYYYTTWVQQYQIHFYVLFVFLDGEGRLNLYLFTYLYINKSLLNCYVLYYHHKHIFRKKNYTRMFLLLFVCIYILVI